MYSSRPIPPARSASPGERRGIPDLDQSRRYGDGQGVFECEQLAGWLCDVLDALANGDSEKVAHRVREQVVALCRRYPVYSAMT